VQALEALYLLSGDACGSSSHAQGAGALPTSSRKRPPGPDTKGSSERPPLGLPLKRASCSAAAPSATHDSNGSSCATLHLAAPAAQARRAPPAAPAARPSTLRRTSRATSSSMNSHSSLRVAFALPPPEGEEEDAGAGQADGLLQQHAAAAASGGGPAQQPEAQQQPQRGCWLAGCPTNQLHVAAALFTSEQDTAGLAGSSSPGEQASRGGPTVVRPTPRRAEGVAAPASPHKQPAPAAMPVPVVVPPLGGGAAAAAAAAAVAGGLGGSAAAFPAGLAGLPAWCWPAAAGLPAAAAAGMLAASAMPGQLPAALLPPGLPFGLAPGLGPYLLGGDFNMNMGLLAQGSMLLPHALPGMMALPQAAALPAALVMAGMAAT
jgi:hypothetical protein